MRLLLALIGTAGAAVAAPEAPLAGAAAGGSSPSVARKGHGGVLAHMRVFSVDGFGAPHFDQCSLSKPVKVVAVIYQLIQAIYKLIADIVFRGYSWDKNNIDEALLHYAYLYKLDASTITVTDRIVKYLKIREFFRRGATEEFTRGVANIIADILSRFVYDKETDCKSVLDGPTREASRKLWQNAAKKNLNAIGDCSDVLGAVGFGVRDFRASEFLRVFGQKRVASHCLGVISTVFASRFPKSKLVGRIVKYLTTFARIADEFLRSYFLEDAHVGNDLNKLLYKPFTGWTFPYWSYTIPGDKKIQYIFFSWLRGVIDTQETVLEDLALFFSMLVTDLGSRLRPGLGQKLLLMYARFVEAGPYLIKLTMYFLTSTQPSTMNDHFYFDEHDRKSHYAYKEGTKGPPESEFDVFFGKVIYRVVGSACANLSLLNNHAINTFCLLSGEASFWSVLKAGVGR